MPLRARESERCVEVSVRLADILSPARVTVRLVAADKRAALDAVARLLGQGTNGVRVADITKVFEEREALASTGVGSGVAIPHGRLGAVVQLVAAVGICKPGVDFDSIDGRPAHILVGVLGP